MERAQKEYDMTQSPARTGHFIGIPYDFRRPTWRRIRRRVWNKGGALLSPRVFGWGYTLNMAHPGAALLLIATLATVLLAIFVG